MSVAKKHNNLSAARVEHMKRLVWGAVHNAGRGRSPEMRWVHVRDAFGIGSTQAQQLCNEYALDPDEVVGEESYDDDK